MPQHNRLNGANRYNSRPVRTTPASHDGQTTETVPFFNRGGVWAVIVILLGLAIIGAITGGRKAAADPVKADPVKLVEPVKVTVPDEPTKPVKVKVNTVDGNKVKGNSGPVIINNGTITSNSNNTTNTVVQQTTVVQQKTVYVEVPVEKRVIVAVPVPVGTPVYRGGDCDDLRDQHDATVKVWQTAIFKK